MISFSAKYFDQFTGKKHGKFLDVFSLVPKGESGVLISW